MLSISLAKKISLTVPSAPRTILSAVVYGRKILSSYVIGQTVVPDGSKIPKTSNFFLAIVITSPTTHKSSPNKSCQTLYQRSIFFSLFLSSSFVKYVPFTTFRFDILKKSEFTPKIVG